MGRAVDQDDVVEVLAKDLWALDTAPTSAPWAMGDMGKSSDFQDTLNAAGCHWDLFHNLGNGSRAPKFRWLVWKALLTSEFSQGIDSVPHDMPVWSYDDRLSIRANKFH